MPKPRDDVQDLKRRLVLLDRLGGRLFVCAEGPHLFEEARGPAPADPRVRDAAALVAACREGRPSLAALRAGLTLAGTPLPVTPSFLAAVHRDLRVLAGPRVPELVRAAGRIFRRHGDLDATWLAEKRARLASLADAARVASVVDAGSSALPAWFERALELIGFVHESEAAEVARAAALALPGSSRDERERGLLFLAHAALAFDPRPRDGGELTFTSKDLAMDPAALRALAERFGGRALRLPEALRLARLDLMRWRERILDLVAGGLPVEKVERLVSLGRIADFGELRSGAEAAAAYADWVSTLVPHYASLGLDLPLSAEVFNRFASARKSDLSVLAVCLMKHHTKAEPDTAEQALARLDATLALFARRPADVASILDELTGTTPGAGRAALPEIAGWLGDDDLLDRYVHLSRIAGAPVPLSRALRADFERSVTIAEERAHLASLRSRSSQQEARLARLLAGQVAVPSPDRTRRRLADRVRELLARAYEARLDAALRRIAKDAWGITVPRLTPGWRDAIRFYLVVEENRELLATVLQTAAAGGDPARLLPRNKAWIASVSGRFDVSAWLAPRARDVDIGGQRHRLAIERDPIEVLRMGIPFDTCLSLEGGMNAASTVVNAADANKHVIYLRDARGSIVARKLVAVSRDHRLIGYRLYIAAKDREPEITAAFREMCDRLAEATGLPLAIEGKPKQIHPGFWYDDGATPFDRASPRTAADVGAYCRSLGVPVPSVVSGDLLEEARIFAASRGERADDVATILADVSTSWTARRAAAWLITVTERPRLIALARRSWKLATEVLRGAAQGGFGPMLHVAGRIAGWQGGAGIAERLAAFVPSVELAFALVSAASAASRCSVKFDSDGLEHQTTFLVPELVRRLPPADGFAVCDRVEPLWRWLLAENAGCVDCVAGAREAMIQALLRAYGAAPDPAAVIDRLGGRAGPLARRAALAIAARHGLAEDGDRSAPRARLAPPLRPCPAAVRALARLRRRAPELEADPYLFAAILRQNAGVPRGADLPAPREKPFEVLADLLARLDLEEALAPWTGGGGDLGEWKPGPWELYHLRRTTTPLRARIVREAKGAIVHGKEGADAEMEEAAHRLALLGEVDALQKLFASCTGRSAAARRTRSILDRARATAKEVAAQVASSRAGDPLAVERERRADGRSKTNTDAHDRGLLLAALAYFDDHVAREPRPSPLRPAGHGRQESDDGDNGAADHGRQESDYGDPGAAAILELACEIAIEADRSLGPANEIAEALVGARPDGFDDDDRSILLLWLSARLEQEQHQNAPPIALPLLADHVLRPHALGAIARTGLYGAERTFEQLAALARHTGRERAVEGLFEAMMDAFYEFGAKDLSPFESEPLFRAAVRVLVGRDTAAPVMAAYRELTDHAMMAAFLDELSRSPLRADPRMQAEAQIWRGQETVRTPAALEWMEACLEGRVPVSEAAARSRREAASGDTGRASRETPPSLPRRRRRRRLA